MPGRGHSEIEGGSISYRLVCIEASIPYEDVREYWAPKRAQWLKEVWLARSSVPQLARLLEELVSALTDKARQSLWSGHMDSYHKLQAQCVRLSSERHDGPTPRRAVAELRKMVADFLAHAVEEDPSLPTPEDMGSHEAPEELEFADDGPVLEVGDVTHAFDHHRRCWCEAEIIGVRGDGRAASQEYRVHYRGWKKRWDEWVPRDSGRLRPLGPRRVVDVVLEAKRRHAAEAAHASSSTGEPEGTADTTGAAPDALAASAEVSAREPRRPPPEPASEASSAMASASVSGAGYSSRASSRSSSGAADGEQRRAAGQRPWHRDGKRASVPEPPGERAVASAGPAELPPPPPSTRGLPEADSVPGSSEDAAAVAATVLEVGQRVIAIDVRCIWCEAKVLDLARVPLVPPGDGQVDGDGGGSGGGGGGGGVMAARLHYLGWNKRWDEWVRFDSGRIRLPTAGFVHTDLLVGTAPVASSDDGGVQGSPPKRPRTARETGGAADAACGADADAAGAAATAAADSTCGAASADADADADATADATAGGDAPHPDHDNKQIVSGRSPPAEWVLPLDLPRRAADNRRAAAPHRRAGRAAVGLTPPAERRQAPHRAAADGPLACARQEEVARPRRSRALAQRHVPHR